MRKPVGFGQGVCFSARFKSLLYFSLGLSEKSLTLDESLAGKVEVG